MLHWWLCQQQWCLGGRGGGDGGGGSRFCQCLAANLASITDLMEIDNTI